MMGDFDIHGRGSRGHGAAAADAHAVATPGKVPLTQASGGLRRMSDPVAALERAMSHAMADVASMELANCSGDVMRAIGLRSLLWSFIDDAPTLVANVGRASAGEYVEPVRAILQRAHAALAAAPHFSEPAREAAQRGDYALWNAELAPWLAKAGVTHRAGSASHGDRGHGGERTMSNGYEAGGGSAVAPASLKVSHTAATATQPAQARSKVPQPTSRSAADDASIAAPEPGIDKPGFIDNSKGAPIYSAPAPVGGAAEGAPLPPAARVFVSGTHSRLKDWWYVTAYLEQTMVRGYVEAFRVNTNLPEPFAELRQLRGGETAEQLAKEKFGHAVEDGHDLRFYENVLLYVNQGRAGIRGTYQDPGILGGGSNNISLVAGHRIWLVSPQYAKALKSAVPSGSLTGGAVAKVRRFGRHLEDILHSVTESRHHFGEVAGELAAAIRNHLPEIIGITAGFLAAEATSMFLAAAPTGVSQAAAVVIQLGLSAFGATGMVLASVEALNHGCAWLTTAWTAEGKPERIAAASREFVRMLVAIAAAALSYVGAKGNYASALKIANNMPTGGLPALAVVGGGTATTAQSMEIGLGLGGPAVTGAAAVRLSDKDKAALGEGPEVDGVRDHEVAEARAKELHDKRAAEGRKTSTAKGSSSWEASPTPSRKRTNLAQHIPPSGDAFVEWFDSLRLPELERLLADESTKVTIGAREIIEDSIRHPGGKHEWLMVAEVRQFKKWGVSMKEILDGRTLTQATIGKNFRHGTGPDIVHKQLRAMIRSSGSYDEFLEKLNRWADHELVPSHSAQFSQDRARGRYSLPESLQRRVRP
jgi:hypothetical protein